MVSYSGIRGHGSGKSTLPSVDSWSTNINIMKDPPKGIMTRRINKISDTNSLNEMIDESSDRACEVINTYARGVNPMVSVSYSGNGNAGMRGNITSISSGKQAYLPYRVMKDGAFVPPSFSQLNLMPLSRLPRLTTSVFTTPGFNDYSKKLLEPQLAETTREVKNSLLKVCSQPTAVYNIGGSYSAIETYEVKNFIQNPILVSANSGIRTRDLTKQLVITPTKEILDNVIHYFTDINLGSSSTVKYSDNNKLSTTRYIHKDILQGNVPTNLFRNIEGKPINETVNIDKNRYTHEDILQGNVPTNLFRNIEGKPINETVNIDKNRYTHEDILQGNVSTNLFRNIEGKPINETANIDTNRYTHEDILQGNVSTNLFRNIEGKPINETANIDKNRYTHEDILQGNVSTNLFRNIEGKPINETVNIDKNRYTQEIHNINYNTVKTGVDKHEYIHSNIIQNKNLPSYQSTTNKCDKTIYVNMQPTNKYNLERKIPKINVDNIDYKNIDRNTYVGSREYKLPPKINIGGFEGKPLYVQQYKENGIPVK